jgi:hypothetical protein
MVGSTLLNVAAQRKQAKQAEQAAELEGVQLERRAMAERAMSQRAALEERRQARLAQSALQARAGGGGPDIDRLDADIEADGEYRALSALFSGDTAANSSTFAAQTRRAAGRDAASASRLGQAASLLSLGSKMYDSYGQGGYKGGANSYAYNDDASGSKYSATGSDVRARR